MDTKDAGWMGGMKTSEAKAQAARTNGTKGGRPKTTYTVREPGASFWWQGTRKAEALKELRKARAAGLTRAEIVTE